ncbi:MAG: hypothetical protein K0R67_2007 [Paenibacillus sp.]|nr:hypothetical protein [Paenibacillus sp.]
MLTGLILAGGPEPGIDRRWKALLQFGEVTLLQHQIREMRKLCQEVILATPDPKPFLKEVDTGIRIITDYYTGRGPLGGMHAGFSLSASPDVWVVRSDMPFLSARAAKLLLERKHEGYDASLPLICGEIYPYHGIYDKSCAEQVSDLLDQGQTAIAQLLQQMSWSGLLDSTFVEHGIDPSFVQNLDAGRSTLKHGIR